VLADTIVIRTAEGTIIDGHADEKVALEVDHIDEALYQGWSVLVRGSAHRVRHPAELHRLQEDAVIWPWPGGEREVYVRIVPARSLAAASRSGDTGDTGLDTLLAGRPAGAARSSCGRRGYRRSPTKAARSASRQV
jgi:hypothetical protein